MHKTTTGICLAAVLVSCSMNGLLWADELIMRDDFFIADESRHQWLTEQNGRSGTLSVTGALVSSPCILDTPEITLPLQKDKGKYVLSINLSHCGYGVSQTAEQHTQVSKKVDIRQRLILKDGEGNVPLPENKRYGVIKNKLSDGDNQLIYYVNKELYGKISRIQAEKALYPMSDNNINLLQLYIMYE